MLNRDDSIRTLKAVFAGRLRLGQYQDIPKRVYNRVSPPVSELVEDEQGNIKSEPAISPDALFECEEDGKQYSFAEIEARAPKVNFPMYAGIGEYDEINRIVVVGATEETQLKELLETMK